MPVTVATDLSAAKQATSAEKQRAKILFLEAGSGFGGSSTFLWYMIKALDKRRFDPVVAFHFPDQGPDVEMIRSLGVPVHSLSRRPRPAFYVPIPWLLTKSKHRWVSLLKMALGLGVRLALTEIPLAWRLHRFIKREHIALIVLNQDIHYHVAWALASKLCKVPCICRKAGGIGEGKYIKKYLVPSVDLFICISRATESDQTCNNPGTRRAVTIYEGVDVSRFAPDAVSPELRRELGISPGTKVVASLARFVEGKGHAELIEAASVIVKNFPNVLFLIAGNENGREGRIFKERLQSRVNELSLQGHVIFTGWRTDVPNLLSVIDILVHCPTTCLEGLGIANLEAMAMGKPTVVSNNGGLPDAVLDGVTGFIVTPGDISALSAAVLQLLRDERLAAQLGRNARQRTEQEFDISKNIMKMETLFSEYLECAPQAGLHSGSVAQPFAPLQESDHFRK